MEPEISFAGSICRICLQLCSDRYDVVQSGLQYLFCELTGIQIKSDDGLPTVMCPTCVYLLNRAVRFRRKCFDSNLYLCDFLQSGQTEFDVGKSQRSPYLTLLVSETVICEVPSNTFDKVTVEYQDSALNAFQKSDCIDFIQDFEPFEVNGATIEPLPSCNTSPKLIHSRKRKRQQRVKDKNEEESLKTAIANIMQKDLVENRSNMEVSFNYDGIPDIDKYFRLCNLENGQPEYLQKDPLCQSDVAKNTSVEEVLTVDESCLYTLKPQFKELTKYFKAQDGTAISTCSLIGPRYLRVEHLTLEQQLEVMEKQRNSEKYLTSPFKCESCALSFPLEYAYLKHMKKHHVSSGPFQCSICKVRMVGRQGLQRHNNSHRLRFVCVLCGARLRSRNIHSKHVMIKHIGMPEILCLLCNKRYKNPLTFRSHDLRQHSQSLLRCPHCPQSFKWRSTLYTHIAEEHTGALPYACKQCPKSYALLSRLQHHKLFVHTKQKFVCEHCKLALPSKPYLERHLLKGCSKPKNYYALECDKCSEVFTKPVRQRYHKALVHDHTFRCDVCEISFKSQKFLDGHNTTGHKTSCCPHCNKRYQNDIGLGIHIRRAHNVNRNLMRKKRRETNATKIKTFQAFKSNHAKRKCLEGPKDTITTIPVENCIKHLAHCRMHAVTCGNRFTNFCYKRENGKFICDFCEKSYETRNELEKHVHPDPHLACKFCQSKFLDYVSIGLHRRFKHPDKPSIILSKMCTCIPKIPSFSVLTVEGGKKNDNSLGADKIDADKSENDLTETDVKPSYIKNIYKIKLKKLVPVNISMFTSQCMDTVESESSDVMSEEFVTTFETYNVQIPYLIQTTSMDSKLQGSKAAGFNRGRVMYCSQKRIRKYTTKLQNNKFTKLLRDKLGLQLQISKPCGQTEANAKFSNLLTLVPINFKDPQQSATSTSSILRKLTFSKSNQECTEELVDSAFSEVEVNTHEHIAKNKTPDSQQTQILKDKLGLQLQINKQCGQTEAIADVNTHENFAKKTTPQLQQTQSVKEKKKSQINHEKSPTVIEMGNTSENVGIWDQETKNISSSSQKFMTIPKTIYNISTPRIVPIIIAKNEAQKIVSITPSLVPIDPQKKKLQEISTNLCGLTPENNTNMSVKFPNPIKPANSLGQTTNLKKNIKQKNYSVADLRRTLKAMENGNHKILLEYNLCDTFNSENMSQLLAFLMKIRGSHPTKYIMLVKRNFEIHAYTMIRHKSLDTVVRLLPILKLKNLEDKGENAV